MNEPYLKENISLYEIYSRIKEFSLFLKQKWVLLFFALVLGATVGFFYHRMQKEIFTARITFIVEDAKSSASGINGLASLAGQLGVDFGSSNGGNLLSGDNILFFFKSPSLAREVLLSNYDKDSSFSIADVYVKVYGLDKLWKNKLGDISFKLNNSIGNSVRLKDSLLQTIINEINLNQFMVNRIDKKSSFIEVVTKMQSENLAKIYCERIVEKVVERYVSIKTERQLSTVKKLQYRADSISNLLMQKTLVGALIQNNTNTMDVNPLFKTKSSVAVETTLRDKALLTSIFASVTQNLELAKFTLSQETPVIQLIDTPIYPLKKDKISPNIAILYGSMIFLTSVILILFFIHYSKTFLNWD